MAYDRASFDYSYPAKDGRQTFVYTVWDGTPLADCSNLTFARFEVDMEWFRREGSLNDLKRLAIEEAERSAQRR